MPNRPNGFLICSVALLALNSGVFAAEPWTLTPEAVLATSFDDNIYNEPTQKTSDLITTLRPELTAKGAFDAIVMKANTYAEKQFYKKHTANTVLNYGGEAKATLPLSPDSSLFGRLGYKLSHEDRGDDDITPANILESPAEWDMYHGALGVQGIFAAYTYKLETQFRQRDYDDAQQTGGGFIDNDLKDRLESDTYFRLGYAVTDTTEMYTQLLLSRVSYDKSDLNDRNSTGLRLLAGVLYSPFDALRFDIALGRLARSFNAYADEAALGYLVKIEYAPFNELTTRFSAERGFRETQDVGASSIDQHNFKSSFTYALDTEWDVLGAAQYTKAAYNGGTSGTGGLARSDSTYEITAGFAYKLNVATQLELTQTHAHRDSNATNKDYSQNITRLGATFSF